jgi:serine/threonine-protein kinase
VLKFLNKNIATDEEMMQRFVHELRNSRKITHRNVIRLYDFCTCAASMPSRWSTFPRTARRRAAQGEPLALTRALQITNDIATGRGGTSRRHRPP